MTSLLSVIFSVHPLVFRSSTLPVCVSIVLYSCAFACLSIPLVFVYMYICFSVRMSICLTACPSICLSICSISFSTCLPSVYLSLLPSVCLPVTDANALKRVRRPSFKNLLHFHSPISSDANRCIFRSNK